MDSCGGIGVDYTQRNALFCTPHSSDFCKLNKCSPIPLNMVLSDLIAELHSFDRMEMNETTDE